MSAWAPCQRAGAGTQCPGRAGGRAGNENSLTQQLGKWVCARSPDQPLLQPAVSDDRLSEAPSNGRGELTAGPSAPRPCLPLAQALHVATWRISLPSRPSFKVSHSPQSEQSRLWPPGRGTLLTPPGRCGRPYSCWMHVPFPSNPTILEGL